MTKRIDQRVGFPEKQGLYDPSFERTHGVGFVAHIKGIASHQIMEDAIFSTAEWTIAEAAGLRKTQVTALVCSLLFLISFRNIYTRPAALPEVGRYAVGNCFLPTDPDLLEKAQAFVEKILLRRTSSIFMAGRTLCTEVPMLARSPRCDAPDCPAHCCAGDGMDEAAFAENCW